MDKVTEIDLILLDVAKVWDLIEGRTQKFLSDIIVGEGEFEEFSDIMEEVNKEVRVLRG